MPVRSAPAQTGDHAPRHRVAALGSVDRHGRDPVRDRVQDLFLCHSVNVVADDPVLRQRARLARLAATGQRTGYLLLLVAIVAFVVGAVTSFPSASVIIVIAALVVAAIVLLPAIILGYAVKAAEREERGEGYRGH
jgi:hypothetical protein